MNLRAIFHLVLIIGLALACGEARQDNSEVVTGEISVNREPHGLNSISPPLPGG